MIFSFFMWNLVGGVRYHQSSVKFPAFALVKNYVFVHMWNLFSLLINVSCWMRQSYYYFVAGDEMTRVFWKSIKEKVDRLF